jgi:hypothetical protein
LWDDIDIEHRIEESKYPSSPARLGLADIEFMIHGVYKGLPSLRFYVDAINKSKDSLLILSTL